MFYDLIERIKNEPVMIFAVVLAVAVTAVISAGWIDLDAFDSVLDQILTALGILAGGAATRHFTVPAREVEYQYDDAEAFFEDE